jgi:hypothetical protein
MPLAVFACVSLGPEKLRMTAVGVDNGALAETAPIDITLKYERMGIALVNSPAKLAIDGYVDLPAAMAALAVNVHDHITVMKAPLHEGRSEGVLGSSAEDAITV